MESMNSALISTTEPENYTAILMLHKMGDPGFPARVRYNTGIPRYGFSTEVWEELNCNPLERLTHVIKVRLGKFFYIHFIFLLGY